MVFRLQRKGVKEVESLAEVMDSPLYFDTPLPR